MAKGNDVLAMLCPNGGWVIYGDDYDSIVWHTEEKITKAEFEAGFPKWDAWKTEQDSEKEAKKLAAEAKLAALGLTPDDLRALGLN